MFKNITVGEMVAMLVMLSGAIGAIAVITSPFQKALNRIDKLERAVFDKDGNVTFPTKSEVDDIKQNTEEIKKAVNTICDAVMALLDAQINGDNQDGLANVKGRLEKQRDIV